MIFQQDTEYIAVLDACVLAPMPACDTLLRLAEDPPVFTPRWSAQILTEVHRTLLNFGYSERQADRRIGTMRYLFPEAEVTGHEPLIQSINLPDLDDRHVVAAAIRAGASAIVTQNTRDFPPAILNGFGILLQSLDDFLIQQFRGSPQLVAERLEQQASGTRSSLSAVLAKLARTAPGFAVQLKQFLGLD